MNRDKRIARLIQVLALVVCLGMAVLAIQNTGLISKIGTEDVYWERARFLLGQKGATTYSGSSICSLGYSLLLVPICVFIKSPYAAYKAAILLNGIFLCGSYVMAVLTAKKLFSKEKESFLSVACFFAVFIPAISISMFYSEPDMLVMFLIWCSIYLLHRIWTAGRTRDLILSIVCLLVMAFLQIEMLGVVIGVVALLWLFVRKEKITEITFLKCVLVFLLGIIAEDIIERIVLWRFAAGMDITVRSSLEVVLDNVKSGVGNGNLAGTLFAKIYILSLTGMFLIYPASIKFIQDVYYAIKQKKNTERMFQNAIITVFFIQVIFIAMFDSSRYIGTGYFSVNGLLTVASPLLLIGIFELKCWKNWISLVLGSFLITGICTYKVADIFEKNKINSVAGHACGIFRLFQDKISDASATIYMVTCVAFLIIAGCFLLFRGKSRNGLVNKCLKYAGTGLCLVLILGLGIRMVQSTIWRSYESEVVDIAPLSYLANSITGDASYYYVAGTGGNDTGIVVMQSLMQGKTIEEVPNDTTERKEVFRTEITESKNPVVITGAKESQLDQTVKECLEGFDILYMTPAYAVWTRKGSQIAKEMEDLIETHAEEMVLQSFEESEAEEELTEEETQNVTETSAETETAMETETITETETATETSTETDTSTETEKKDSEKKYKKVYKNNMNLAHGTYRMEIYFRGENVGDNLTGKIKISSKEGFICSKSFDRNTIMQDSNGAVIVEFSSRNTMHDVEAQIEGDILSSVSVEHIYYRKLSNTYRIGYASERQVKATCNVIKTVDKNCEQNGSVAFVDAFASEDTEISVEYFQNNLDGYQVDGITREEVQKTNAEYLIATTSFHSYYEAMDRYSIISRTKNYTVLVRNDSEQYQECQDQGMVLSEGQRISVDGFVSGRNTNKPISLESGSYEYEINVTGLNRIARNTQFKLLGRVVVRNENEILAERVVTKDDVNAQTGKVTVNIPLYLKNKTENIYCEFRGIKKNSVHTSVTAISMTAEKYEYGKEEKEFPELTDTIQSLVSEKKNNGTVKVGIVQTEAKIKEHQTGYCSIEEALPGCQIEEVSFSDAKQLTEDAILLTYGISKQHLQLLDKYNIIGQAGQYTLWVCNCGELLQKANQEGIMTINSDKRLPLNCIAKMSGQDAENIVNLPKAEYNLIIELEAKGMEEDDTVEVNLVVDKSESEIKSEIKELVENGYTMSEAKERVETRKVCGSATYQAYTFNGAETKLVAIKTSDTKIRNLEIDVYTWHNKKIKGKVIWVALK